jgi:hypothetical protein
LFIDYLLFVSCFKDALVAMERLDEFFGEDEVEPSVRYELPKHSDEAVIVVCEYLILFVE